MTLRDPELRDLDQKVTREAAVWNRRLLIGCLIGAIIGLVAPLILNVLQNLAENLYGWIFIIVCTILGGLWGIITSPNGHGRKR